ncbi:uncharacterized protein LOC119080405 [Bradysia coprophila]|uniref:uncharacterized protein LOC119080405 n=1 Tax=Bradysia coprophila TaxID=38358 RepID=UPI00187D7D9E|nr:uncharacterized protein LOC119080405 [Bradysia coprophila]
MSSAPTTDGGSRPMKCKNKNKSKFTCIPIGLTQGQFNLNAFKIVEQYKWFQMRSACLMAFCHLYIQDPLKWTSQTINKILINGAKVVKENFEHANDNGPLDCILNVENYVAKIRIEEPIILDTSPSLIDTVQSFFNNHQHGLFRCLNLCYLIWKTNEIYFIFDGQGSGSAVDDKYGFASLVCTESTRDVSKLLRTLSSIKSGDCYSVSAIKMKHFREGVGNYTKPRIQYVGMNPYKIVNDCFAILSGKFHVEYNGFQSLKMRQSITVNLMALIFHAIQPVNSWNSQLIDKIILLGTKLFHECKKSPQGEVTIHHLPHTYRILDYKFKIDYKPYDHSGQRSYSLDEMEKNLLIYLKRAFPATAKNASVFIQTNSMTFAVWESNNYFYLFDAYARNPVGQIADDQFGMACIQMHSSFESLCNVLATNLHAIAANDGFVLHGINVTLTTNDGKPVADTDLELISEFLDDLFWTEMNSIQESSARSDEICNLDESSDDDIFMETVLGEKRTASSIQSSSSRSTTSFASESETVDSRTDDSSSRTSDSNSQSNDDSDSQGSKTKKSRSKSPKKLRENDSDSQASQAKIGRSKSPKNRKEDDSDSQGNLAKKDRSKSPKKRKENGSDSQGSQAKKDPESPKNLKENNEQTMDVDVKEKSKKKRNKEKRSKKLKNEADNGDDGHIQKEGGKKGKKNGKGEDKDDKDTSKQSLVVVESSSGTETSISKLLNTSFKISDRVLLATEWGDFFVAFENNSYFLVDGCVCDYNALIRINFTQMDSFKKIDSIDGIVSEIMQSKNVTIRSEAGDVKDIARSTEIIEVQPPFSSDVDAPMWELIEGMIELMKTTAKFDKIKNELA